MRVPSRSTKSVEWPIYLTLGGSQVISNRQERHDQPSRLCLGKIAGSGRKCLGHCCNNLCEPLVLAREMSVLHVQVGLDLPGRVEGRVGIFPGVFSTLIGRRA